MPEPELTPLGEPPTALGYRIEAVAGASRVLAQPGRHKARWAAILEGRDAKTDR